jgi:hypothetical protein
MINTAKKLLADHSQMQGSIDAHHWGKRKLEH